MRKNLKLFLLSFVFALAAIFSCGLVFGNVQTASASGGIYIEDGADVEINGGIMNNNEDKALYFESGDHEINNLTITGSKNGAVYIKSGNITINNCHFEKNSNAQGGAIYVGAGASLTILNSTILNNSSTAEGGAIYLAEGASLNMQGSVVSNNNAVSGGVICLAKGATATIASSEFAYNSANNGAVICAQEQGDASNKISVTISNTTISNNESSETGIVVLSDYSTLVMDHVDFTENETVGGVIFQLGANATSTITNGSFIENTADVTIISGSTTTINACTFNENTNLIALMMHGSNNTFNVEDVTITNNMINSEDGVGGVIFAANEDDSVVPNLIVEDVTITGNFGSAIYANNANLTLKGNIDIQGNTAVSGAGMALGNTILNVENGCVINIENNIATTTDLNGINGWGAGIMIMESGTASKTYDFRGAVIKGNSALQCGGGLAIFDMSTASCDIVIKNVTFEGNSAADGAGVVVAQLGKANFELENVVIKDNKGTDGAGICHSGRPGLELTLSGTTKIVDNIATGNGGAIYYDSNVNVVYNGIEISGNTAVNGGAIYFKHDSSTTAATLAGLNISNNTATNGGGIYVENSGAVTISACQFTNNTAANGGGVYVANDNVTIENCVIDSNTANYGGGIYVSGDTTFAGSTSITNNIAHIIGGGIGINEGVTVTVNNIEIVGNKVLPASMVDDGSAQTLVGNNQGNSFIAALTLKEGHGTVSLALISIIIVSLLAVVLQKPYSLKKIRK